VDDKTVVEKIKEQLIFEKNNKMSGGLYHKSQIAFAYNSNRIEGSSLTHDETAQIFETQNILIEKNVAKPVNDIVETINHFKAFDTVLNTVSKVANEKYIKQLHFTLKNGIFIEKEQVQIIGDWKKQENYVGDVKTVHPDNVGIEIKKLIKMETKNLEDIATFHYRFENIHPFYDGNGRVGRLLAFKQCLENNVLPFIILNSQKAYYYRGLKKFKNDKQYLTGTFEAAQDAYLESAKNLF
jgi:Fic family protein